MISWDNFECFVAPAALCWIAGAVLSARQAIRSRAALWTTLAGTLIFAVFIAGLWTTLSRPPLRTMGETRLWYSFFLSISGLITYWRWRYRWVLPFTTLLALVFCMINILKPEIHDQSLMPALQSPWFIPHVTVYMFSYSVLGCSFPASDSTVTSPNISTRSISWSMSVWRSSRWACFRELFGPRMPGATIGAGTPRKPGRRSPGSVICCMCTCASCRACHTASFTGF